MVIQRRVRLALGFWNLLRYQTRLCRWFPTISRRDPLGVIDTVRWLGNVRIGGRSHHALLSPPPSEVTYRLLAAPRSKLEVWCGLLPGPRERTTGSVEFAATVLVDGMAHPITRSLRVDLDQSAHPDRWHELVLDLRNREPRRIDVTLSTRLPERAPQSDVAAIWGEPKLVSRRPLGDIVRLLRSVAPQAARGKLMSAARTLHGRLSTSAQALYDLWVSRRTLSPEELQRMRVLSDSFRYQPLVSVVVPVFNTDARWLRACIESVTRQAYPRWQLCLADDGSTRPETRDVLRQYEGDPRIQIYTSPSNAGIAAASNAALALADGEFVAFLDHDDEITPDALFEVVAQLNAHPETDFIYSDEDKLELDGSRSGPYFKPDWSPEHFLNNMYTCHLMVVRRTLLQRIEGFRAGYEGAQDYDLVLRLMDHTARIRHLAKVLYHWRKIPESTAAEMGAKPFADEAGKRALQDYFRRNRVSAEVLPGDYRCFYRTRFAIRDEPLISIVLPPLEERHGLDAERRDACERTVRTLSARTAYRRVEIVLAISADSAGPATQLLRGLPYREIRVEAGPPLNRTSQLNLAAAQAEGEQLLFLEWGLDALDSEWLTSLLEYSQQEAIGAVGGKLLSPDGSLEHIGMLLGVNGVAAPAYYRHPRSSPGYWGSAIIARNYSAVTGACLMTRRRVFEELGGFREELRWFADVDYGLRVTSAGYRVVATPYARLARVAPSTPIAGAAVEEEARLLEALWGDRLARDPYYNPNLSRDSPDYEPDLSPTVRSDA